MLRGERRACQTSRRNAGATRSEPMMLVLSVVLGLVPLAGIAWTVQNGMITTVDGLVHEHHSAGAFRNTFLERIPRSAQEVCTEESAAGAENELTWLPRLQLSRPRPPLPAQDSCCRLSRCGGGNWCASTGSALAWWESSRHRCCSGWSSAPASAVRFARAVRPDSSTIWIISIPAR